MAERLSALKHLKAPAGDGNVTLAEVPYGSILQVQAWPETLPTVGAVLISEFLDEDLPPLGSAVARNGAVVAAVAPGRFMIAHAEADLARRMEGALAVGDAAVSDLSHGRAILALEGEAASLVLSKCVAIDLDPQIFPPGRVAATMIHHVDVLIHRRSETRFELWVLRSFAEALAEWLLDQGAEQKIGFGAV